MALGHMPRVLIVSDILLYQIGLVEIVTRDGRLEIAGSASSLEEAVSAVEELHPDVVLHDMSVSDALASIGVLRRLNPSTKIVALGVFEDSRQIVDCAEAGIAGYVCRDSSVDDLVRAVKNALRGDLSCSPRIAGALLQHVRRTGPSPMCGCQHLTYREQEITELVEEGLTNQEIATRLSIQVATVKTHVHNILEKTGVHRRSQAAAKLRRIGLLSPRIVAASPR